MPTVKLVELLNVTELATVTAPVELINSTLGTDTKFVPVNVNVVSVLGSIAILEDVIVGLSIVDIVVEPPKDTLDPLIVIDECCNFVLCTALFLIWTVSTVSFEGVPIETKSPNIITKSIVSDEPGASVNVIVLLLIVKASPGAWITPDTETNIQPEENVTSEMDNIDSGEMETDISPQTMETQQV